MACGAFYTATETVARPGHRAFEEARKLAPAEYNLALFYDTRLDPRS